MRKQIDSLRVQIESKQHELDTVSKAEGLSSPRGEEVVRELRGLTCRLETIEQIYAAETPSLRDARRPRSSRANTQKRSSSS